MMHCNQCGAKSTSEDPIDCPQCKCIARQQIALINMADEREKLQEEYDSAFCGLLGASRAECIEFGRSQRRVYIALVRNNIVKVFSTQIEISEFLDEIKDIGEQEIWELGE